MGGSRRARCLYICTPLGNDGQKRNEQILATVASRYARRNIKSHLFLYIWRCVGAISKVKNSICTWWRKLPGYYRQNRTCEQRTPRFVPNRQCYKPKSIHRQILDRLISTRCTSIGFCNRCNGCAKYMFG